MNAKETDDRGFLSFPTMMYTQNKMTEFFLWLWYSKEDAKTF